MIDLNSLTLYKEKISSYVNENALDISTKSNILSLFKIKNYTGTGLIKSGNVQIDENGIASYFVNNTDYVKTNLTSIDFFNAFEFQIKFKPQHDKYNYLIGWYSFPHFEISYSEGYFSILEYKTSSHTSDYFKC